MSLTKQTQEQTHERTMSATEIQQLNERVVQLEELVKRLTGATEEAKEVVKEAPKAKKAKSEGPTLTKKGVERKKPKMSGYRVFCAAERANAKAELEKETGGKVGMGPVTKKLGEMWKDLSEEEQQVWKDDAEEIEKEKQQKEEDEEDGSEED